MIDFLRVIEVTATLQGNAPFILPLAGAKAINLKEIKIIWLDIYHF